MGVLGILAELLTTIFWIVFYILRSFAFLVTPNRWRYKDVRGSIVLITGAGSGLGRGMSVKFAKLGCTLILWDINREGNEETARLVRSHGAEVHTYTVDVVDKKQIYDLASEIKEKIGDVDILVNNAGIVTGKKFMDSPDPHVTRTMEVNIMAHFWITKSFLPAMISRNRGHLVTIASSAGLFGVKGLADYCASKYAAVGFHEAMEAELFGLGLDGINTTLVCPYFIDTGMFEGVKARIPLSKESTTVELIVDSILVNKRQLIVPWYLCLALIAKSMLPVQCSLLIGQFLGMSTSMDEFVGRAKRD